MGSITPEEIRKTVRDVLNELGLSKTEKPKARPASSQSNGPRALIVFHAGVRKLDEALKQVRLIEEVAGKSGVFTGESARDWVCGDDVKGKAGVRCILDNVKPGALGKVLDRADILVLPTLCLKVAAKVAHLTCDDQESSIVLSALLQGKKVLASRDGFLICDILVNLKLREEIEWLFGKLESYGMVFSSTDRLKETFQELAFSPQGSGTLTPAEATVDDAALPLNLITAKSINTAVDNKRNSIVLAPGGKVTPLASDMAKEYNIEIIET